MKGWLAVIVLGIALWRVGRRSVAWQDLEEKVKNLSDWFVALSLSATSEFEKKVGS